MATQNTASIRNWKEMGSFELGGKTTCWDCKHAYRKLKMPGKIWNPQSRPREHADRVCFAAGQHRACMSRIRMWYMQTGRLYMYHYRRLRNRRDFHMCAVNNVSSILPFWDVFCSAYDTMGLSTSAGNEKQQQQIRRYRYVFSNQKKPLSLTLNWGAPSPSESDYLPFSRVDTHAYTPAGHTHTF